MEKVEARGDAFWAGGAQLDVIIYNESYTACRQTSHCKILTHDVLKLVMMGNGVSSRGFGFFLSRLLVIYYRWKGGNYRSLRWKTSNMVYRKALYFLSIVSNWQLHILD